MLVGKSQLPSQKEEELGVSLLVEPEPGHLRRRVGAICSRRIFNRVLRTGFFVFVRCRNRLREFVGSALLVRSCSENTIREIAID